MTNEEKIENISKKIEDVESKPVQSLYGRELGIAKLVRDGRTFRIFVKEVQESKSGKAMLVEMKVFVQKDGEEFALVRGHTYLPKFVLEGNDVYWIIENKIYGKISNDAEDLRIDAKYIPKEFNIRGNFWAEENDSSAEKSAEQHVSLLKSIRESFQEDIIMEQFNKRLIVA